MSLSCNQIRLLTLTARKADCEYGLTIGSMNKMSLTREMSALSSEYYSKLQSKQISYYANGQYNKMNYNYLMGGINYSPIANNTGTVKTNNSMVLTDCNGRTVLSDQYADAILTAGVSSMDVYGKGTTFSLDDIPKIIANLSGFPVDEQTIKNVMNGGKLDSSYAANVILSMGEISTGKTSSVNNTDEATSLVQKLIDFYYPIFAAAAANGWTTEYNEHMNPEASEYNEDYISDGLVSGMLQLASVNEYGEYDEQGSLTYFITAGFIESRSDSEKREEVTAWYNAEKDRISEKETMIDLYIDELSTELEAIKTEMKSIESLIQDAIGSVFDWGKS